MIKSFFVVTAMLIAAPGFAQSAAPERPYCSAKITDGCQQTKAQQARAMTGAQADARDARAGGWEPDKAGKTATTTKATPKKHKAKTHKRTVRVTKVIVAPAAAPQ